MQQIVLVGRFHGEAAAPSGDPPQTDPRGVSVSLTATTAEGANAGISSVSYENHVSYTGPTTFSEKGTVRVDEGEAEYDIVSVSDGTLGPSADPAVLHGAIVYQVVAGRGRFEGVSGLVTSNFVLSATTGQFDETQVAVLFLP